MSGETEKQVSGWTVDTLKEYFEQRFTAQEKAVKTANEASEKRFDAVNEFRGQLGDQVRTFLPRTEYDARHETLENRVSELTDRLNRSDGKVQGTDITMGKIYAAIGAVGAILAIIVLLSNQVF